MHQNQYLLKKYILVIVLFCSLSTILSAQYKHENIFPSLKGQDLLNAVVSDYKTSQVLDYSIARDTLFSIIDGVQDSLECIYTGMKLYMTPGQDPTESVYLDGIANGMNTEHTWPQGLGATGIAQSDMHHLYPTRSKANTDRGNFIFGEIPDNQTQIWYYKSTERTSPPSVNRDLFSEGIRGNNGKFEPRESVKGNIARSIFYFYTMYKAQADAGDPTYFASMKNDLCAWHYADPVDRVEWERNQKISKYQGDKLNPFVLDCSLVSRAYCNNIDQACEALLLSSTENIQIKKSISVYPNPSQGNFYLNINQYQATTILININNTNGQSIYKEQYEVGSGYNLIQIDLSQYKSGVYMIMIADLNRNQIAYVPYILLN